MIIEIESYTGDILLFGKALSSGQLKKQMKEILAQVSEQDFVALFCARNNFEVLPYDKKVKADFVIDLDTHLIMQPKYNG